MLMQRLAYIHNNPVKRGYVDLPEHWRYSSARAYAGENALLPVVLLYVSFPSAGLGMPIPQALLGLLQKRM